MMHKLLCLQHNNLINNLRNSDINWNKRRYIFKRKTDEKMNQQ